MIYKLNNWSIPDVQINLFWIFPEWRPSQEKHGIKSHFTPHPGLLPEGEGESRFDWPFGDFSDGHWLEMI